MGEGEGWVGQVIGEEMSFVFLSYPLKNQAPVLLTTPLKKENPFF